MTLIAKEKSVSLFPSKYIKAKLDNFKLDSIPEKRQIILSWQEAIRNGSIHKTKEEALQADFLNKFFGDVLDYAYDMGKGKWNLSKEQKADTDNTKADGALGFFNPDSQDVRVVIELKDANTDLDKPQNRKNDKRSPVEQAFSYSSKSGGKCKWVIVSNFVEIRLYHSSDQSKYELFKIEELLKLDELKRFLFLLSKERLIAEKGDSGIDAFFAQRQAEEDSITKEFYKEFKEMRSALFEHLKTHNKDIPELLLFEKTQKFLDRFIFCCFCEDMAIIPRWTFRGILKQYRESVLDPSEDKLWRTVKGLFRSIDEGNPRADINKFNGGLFAKDKDLDNLIVKDSLLEKLLTLEKYDFESDLNVNILGHIFEQSISDIEEIKAQIEGKEADKKTGKRKKDGIYYTPAYITKYIVEQTVGRWLDDRKQELGFENLPELDYELFIDPELRNLVKGNEKELNKKKKQHLEFWTAYKEKLSSIKILDPACGSGAFLNQAFDYLYAEHERVNENLAKLKDGQRDISENLTKLILKNNLYGVDLNEESVQITKLSLWLKTANRNSELTTLDDNIKCGNSLIDDPEVAGDKAFKWEEEFKEIFKNGGFDVVIGNPPYGAELPEKIQEYLNKKYNVGSTDTAILFIRKSFGFLQRVEGYLSFIIPKAFSYASNYSRIREFTLDNLFDLVDCKKVWKEVKLEQVITSFMVKSVSNYQSKKLNGGNFELIANVDKSQCTKFGFILNGVSTIETNIALKACSQNIFLNDIANNRRGATLQKHILDVGELNVIGGAEVQRFGIEGIKGKINKKFIDSDQAYIKANSVLVQNIVAHIENPTDHIQITASLSENCSEIIVDTINQITLREDYSNKLLWCLLNSKFINWYVYRFIFGKAIRTMHFDALVTARIPFPNISPEEQKPFIKKADIMLEKNKELQEIKKKFIKLLQSEFNLTSNPSPEREGSEGKLKLSQKLQKWNELDWSEFEKELQKLKIKLSLAQKKEWMEFFESEKKIANEIQALIDKTDKEIDSMVYKLYELTDEEIAIVEGKG